MKILIYGFKPFGGYKENISEKVVEKLKEENFKKVILPVVPRAKIILNHIKRIKPDIVIGIGLCGKGRFIRIERRAKNIYRSGELKLAKKINPRGLKSYLVNLKLNKVPGTQISYDAGQYVCNFTIYNIMDWIQKDRLPMKFAFIHIPYNFKVQKAAEITKKLIIQTKNRYVV